MTPPKASDAAIERACDELNATGRWEPGYWTTHDAGGAYLNSYIDRVQATSDALRTVHGDNIPEQLAGFVLPVVVDVVDPILEMVREAFADALEQDRMLGSAKAFREGRLDTQAEFRAALSVARAIAAKGGGK